MGKKKKTLKHCRKRGKMPVLQNNHSSLTIVCCFDNGHVGKQPVAWKEYGAQYWLKELQESIDRCSGRCNIIEILLTRGP